MTDILLAPIDGPTPCGPNLEYDADFLQLQACASGKSEQQYGDTLIAAVPPDWTRVEQFATTLLTRTKDLRVVTSLTRAWIQQSGFAGLARGLSLAAALLERYWDAVHPELTIDGEFDPLPRVNVLRELAGASGCPQAARDCVLVGGMNARAVAAAVARDRTPSQPSSPGDENIVSDLRAAYANGESAIASALDTIDALQAIREAMRTRLGDEWMFDASAVERDLAIVAESVWTSEGDAPMQQGSEGRTRNAREAAAPTSSSAPSPVAQPVAIASRADVERCLTALCRYFEQYEPSHPAPLLLRRVQRLLALDFYQILQDIAPDGLRQLEALSGCSAEEYATGARTKEPTSAQ